MIHNLQFYTVLQKLLVLLSLTIYLSSCKTTADISKSHKLGQPLMSIEVTEGTNMAVALSPDGTQMIIDLQGTLWALPVAGGKAKSITEPLGDARQPSWAPDGQKICFQGYWEGNWHIYVIDKNGANLKTVNHWKI